MTLELSKCLYSFFSSFGIRCFEENSVPDEATLPYITYTVNAPDWSETGSITASIWYGGSKITVVAKKADEIEKRIDEEPRIPAKNGGCVYLFKENPFAQVAPTENGNVKVITLNIGLHNLCK